MREPGTRLVMLLTGAAIHDDRQYEEPDLFSIHGKAERPLSFGFGVHLCIGAALGDRDGRSRRDGQRAFRFAKADGYRHRTRRL